MEGICEGNPEEIKETFTVKNQADIEDKASIPTEIQI